MKLGFLSQRISLKLLVFVHNFSYNRISKILVRKYNGVHPKHKIMKYHDFFVNNVNNRDRILEIGCGNGNLAYDVSKKSKSYLGVDIDKKNIIFAKKNYSNEGLKFLLADATKYDFKEEFDVIILSNVLEHIKFRKSFLKNIKQLAPKLLIRVPMITRSWLPVYLKENGFEYRLDKTHYIEYTKDGIINELKDSGIDVIDYYIDWGEIYLICQRE